MQLTTTRFDPQLETAYRKYYLDADALQLFLGVILWLVSFIGFGYSDFLLYGFDRAVLPLMVLRLSYTVCCVVFLILLRGKTLTSISYDRIALAWGLLTVLINLGVTLLRPRGDLSVLINDLVGVFSFYVFISGSILRRFLPALLMTVVDLGLIVLFKQGLDGQVVLALGFSFIITNLVGMIFSRHYYDIRRAEFLARNEEARIQAELQRLASTDPLTGIYNRRRLLELVGEALYRNRRYGRPFSIMVLDLDEFKQVNDTFGHHQGDAVLTEFTRAVIEQKREGDSLGRMGGDEFCLLLPETDPQAAAVLADRILRSCSNIELDDTLHHLKLTVSIGIAHAQAGDHTLDPIFARADAALYRAKNNGRNRYEIA